MPIACAVIYLAAFACFIARRKRQRAEGPAQTTNPAQATELHGEEKTQEMKITGWELIDRDGGAALPNDLRRDLGKDVGVGLPALNQGHSGMLKSDRNGALIASQRSRGVSEWLDRVVAIEDMHQRMDPLAVGQTTSINSVAMKVDILDILFPSSLSLWLKFLKNSIV